MNDQQRSCHKRGFCLGLFSRIQMFGCKSAWTHPRKTYIMKYINVSLDCSPTTFFNKKLLCNPIVSTLNFIDAINLQLDPVL